MIFCCVGFRRVYAQWRCITGRAWQRAPRRLIMSAVSVDSSLKWVFLDLHWTLKHFWYSRLRKHYLSANLCYAKTVKPIKRNVFAGRMRLLTLEVFFSSYINFLIITVSKLFFFLSNVSSFKASHSTWIVLEYKSLILILNRILKMEGWGWIEL